MVKKHVSRLTIKISFSFACSFLFKRVGYHFCPGWNNLIYYVHILCQNACSIYLFIFALHFPFSWSMHFIKVIYMLLYPTALKCILSIVVNSFGGGYIASALFLSGSASFSWASVSFFPGSQQRSHEKACSLLCLLFVFLI